MCVYGVWMHACLHMYVCAGVGVSHDSRGWHRTSSSITLDFVYWGKVSGELTDLLVLLTSMVHGSLVSTFPSAGITGSCHTCLAFTWVLGICALVLMQEVHHPLGHLSVPIRTAFLFGSALRYEFISLPCCHGLCSSVFLTLLFPSSPLPHSAGVGTRGPVHANKHSKLDFKPLHIPLHDCTVSYHVDSPLFRIP